MSRLIFIRHAQATFSPDRTRAFRDYDRLSPLGTTQCQALGEELAASGTRFDRVHVGPAERHRQTVDGVGEAYRRRGLDWPEAQPVPELAEHDGAGVVHRALRSPHFASDKARLDALEEAAGGSGPGLQRAYFDFFRRVTRRWATAELPPELVEESWQEFRGRVDRAVSAILDSLRRGTTVGVFTSGGPIGSTVASVLGLSDVQALELAWVVQNATVTELLCSDERVSLKSFNVQPRLGSPELCTYV